MRRSTPIGFVASAWIVALVALLPANVNAGQVCEFDPIENKLFCEEDGTIVDPGDPSVPPGDLDDPGLRYVYTDTDPVLGDCYYWSNVPGGLDAWNPADDAAIVTITTSLPLCPAVPGVDPAIRAWQVFRSWDLDPPSPTLSPEVAGVTGLDTYLEAIPPPVILHDEVLPDGRALEVRARVTQLDVDWGDGTLATHAPSEASGYPDGAVTHVYELKTCTPQYRAEHPSGGLCHPSLEAYPIVVAHTWVGEYRVGGGAWTALGALVRTAFLTYDVDEVRGVPVVP